MDLHSPSTVATHDPPHISLTRVTWSTRARPGTIHQLKDADWGPKPRIIVEDEKRKFFRYGTQSRMLLLFWSLLWSSGYRASRYGARVIFEGARGEAKLENIIGGYPLP